MKTINLKGNEYAPVDERLKAFHATYPNNSITTRIEFKERFIVAYATIVLDVDKPARIYNGSSFGEITKEKAFEKLETVAVGRALAFAGFLADGKIASYEEMEKFFDGEDIVENKVEQEKKELSKAIDNHPVFQEMKTCPKCNKKHNGRFPKCFDCWKLEKDGIKMEKISGEDDEANGSIRLEDVPF
jgi:hypothetical protein